MFSGKTKLGLQIVRTRESEIYFTKLNVEHASRDESIIHYEFDLGLKERNLPGRPQIPMCTNTIRFSNGTSWANSTTTTFSASAAYSKSMTGRLNISL